MKKEKVNAAQSGTFLLGGDLPINRMGFGAMRITGAGIWGPPTNKTEALRVLRCLPELGVNFVDTADSYGPDVSEELIAEALYPYPKGMVIATKGGFMRPGPNKWKPNGKPEYLLEALKGSLKRLKVDRIDLYQLHRIDPEVPMEDSLGVLKDAQQQGLIKYFGLSEVSVEQLDKAAQIIDIASVQNMYNLIERRWEDVLTWCEEHQAGFIPWYPLSAGSIDSQEIIGSIGAKHGASGYQVALAWLLQHSPVMLPIPGTSTTNHLEENVAAVQVELDEEDLSKLNEIYHMQK
ncbi:aldo/keto reductase [Arundinibacter roseus]|uniref:Aldo/keto reductase n=1 Tax=Arundinibacter roseus TaxID=2070510 RepID=A0A4R4K482_9BACT|nr:aldo/keto reductase [Arundinibacter roseus]TDB61432.1 aldo/keto reductase [Arundinibacter roseus]